MTTKPLVMDQRLLDAISALEIYCQMYKDTGQREKARMAAEAIENLKICAFDSHSYVDQGETLFGCFNKHIAEELRKPSVTEPDLDFGPPIVYTDGMPMDELKCYNILQGVINNQASFYWYPVCHGAHTVWTAMVYRELTVTKVCGLCEIDIWNDDTPTIRAAEFTDGEIVFDGEYYYPNCARSPVPDSTLFDDHDDHCEDEDDGEPVMLI